MELEIFTNVDTLSEAVANKILEIIKKKPSATICLTSGSTPELAYKLLVNKILDEKIDYSKCTFIGLDEWVGIGPENIGACQYIIKKLVIEPLQINPKKSHFFDGLATDLEAECKKIDKIIFENGGLDFIIVGIGLNGHLGLNEPNVPANNYSHIVDLEQITIQTGQKYFDTKTPLTQGITIGLQHLQEAKVAVLMANGANKAAIIEQTITSEISMVVPATQIRKHKNAYIMIDQEAAIKLK